MPLKTHGRVSLHVYLPMVGVFTKQFKEKYCCCRFAKTITIAKFEWIGEDTNYGQKLNNKENWKLH